MSALSISHYYDPLDKALSVREWPRICRDIKLHGGEDCSASRLWRLEGEALKYKQEFLHQWTAAGLDAIICPPFPVVAGPKGTMDNMSTFMSYTVLYNLLNYPGGVVPVTKVSHADIESLEDHQGHYGDPWDIVIKTMNKDSLGMPVGVQCVALPWQDEICLRVMKEVESLVNF
ncbi:unnamed protein product [Clavelina lepadiformis]|uniref:Amidase domain-containing protein n=1 Tax=Clavelina lepadiformis TaxID=159417 RepID=A0ABP0F6V0_CLALP